MKFQYGFLDNNAHLMINDIRKEHSEQYKLVFEIIEFIDKIMSDEECKKYSNDREKYIIGTFYDCYATYSSEILLLERGLISDYCILLRTFYEKKFKLFAVIRNKKYYNKVIDEREYYSTDLAKRILENKGHIFDDFVNKINKDDYNFDTYESKRMSVESWANNSLLRSEYERQYSLLSEKTHYGIGSLAEKLETNEDDKITYLTFSYTNFEENLIIASYEMVKCIEKFLEFFDCKKYFSEVDKIDKQFEKIVKQLNQKEDN